MALKLELGGELNNWEKFKARKGIQSFLNIRHKILARDKETCQFCGYQGKTLEVINYDNHYENNTPKNLITACVFCARCRLLDYYKLDYAGNDRMLYFPELSQADLNLLYRTLFFETAQENNSEGSYNAKTLLAQLLDRAALLDEKAGAKLSHPGLFLFYLNSAQKSRELVSKIRWMPDPNEYKDIIKIWQVEMSQ